MKGYWKTRAALALVAFILSLAFPLALVWAQPGSVGEEWVWIDMHVDDDVGSVPQLYGVWGASDSAVYAVGDGGTILHYDGMAWTKDNFTVPDRKGGEESVDLRDVWGTSSGDVYAVGARGTVLRYDGVSWRQMATEEWAEVELLGVWGILDDYSLHIFAVGEHGTILHYDGTIWQQEQVFHWDEEKTHDWVPTDVPHLRGIWGNSLDDLWAVGDYGHILHYDEWQWRVSYREGDVPDGLQPYP
jgi:hypothetical protein